MPYFLACWFHPMLRILPFTIDYANKNMEAHILHLMSHMMKKIYFCVFEQQRCGSGCAIAQPDPHLCCSLPRKYVNSIFSIQNFEYLSSFCSWDGWFVSYLVAYQEDTFSGTETLILSRHLPSVAAIGFEELLLSKTFLCLRRNEILHEKWVGRPPVWALLILKYWWNKEY